MESKRSLATIVLGIIVSAAFVLYMVVFTVSFSETAVVTTFGKVTRTYSDPDWHLKWPWPVEQVITFDNRLRVHESKLEQLYTQDEQSVTVMAFTSWRVPEGEEQVERYLKEIRTREKAEQILTTLVHDAIGAVVGRHRFESFVSMDPERMKFTDIEAELKEMIQGRALENYGIEVTAVGIERLELPEEATKKVFDHMKEERQRLAKRYRAEGEAEARRIKTRAEEQASKIRDRAQAQAIAIRGEGDAEAAKYYAIFASYPELHTFIKRLEALKQMLPKRTTLILEADQVPPFDLIGSQTLQWLLQNPAPATATQPAASDPLLSSK